MLERRIDAVIFRVGIAQSHRQARQLVAHGHFAVNGRRVTIPSYRVNVGDVITLRNKNELARENNVLSVNFTQEKNVSIPEWLRFDPSEKRVEVFRLPTRKDIEPSFNPKLILEFYSR